MLQVLEDLKDHAEKMYASWKADIGHCEAEWNALTSKIEEAIGIHCTNPRCLLHLEQTTKSEVVRRQWQMPDTRALKTAAATAASRARGRASIETAREIRASDETLEVVAQRAGISISTASLIRRGLRWAETRNPFAGLMSGNSQ
jgi:hypothetical protein